MDEVIEETNDIFEKAKADREKRRAAVGGKGWFEGYMNGKFPKSRECATCGSSMTAGLGSKVNGKDFCDRICSSNYGYSAPADNDMDAQVASGRVESSDYYGKAASTEEIGSRLAKMSNPNQDFLNRFGSMSQ